MPGYVLTAAAILVFGILSGCSMTTDSAANDAAAVDALNAWWKEATYTPPPATAGAQTKQEADEGPRTRVGRSIFGLLCGASVSRARP